MCRCLKHNVKGQVCFLFWPYAVHHMGTSIFHPGHPYHMIYLCLTATLAHCQHCCFLFFQHKISVVWLIISQMYSFGLFPSGSLVSQGGNVWDKHSEFPVMSPDSSSMMLSLTPHRDLYLPGYHSLAEAAPCNSIWEASHSSFRWGIQMHPFEFNGWKNLFIKPELLPWCCPLISRSLLTSKTDRVAQKLFLNYAL